MAAAAPGPPEFRVLGWNIENYGVSKDDKGGDELIAFIAQVIRKKQVKVAAFSEIRGLMAADIGNRLASELGVNWTFHPSRKWGVGRWEQYLFVWDTTVVQANVPADFLDDIRDGAGNQIGFWRLTKDRPPFVGNFTTVQGAVQVTIAIMHSPNPQPWTFPRDAARNLAQVNELQIGARATLLLGDFNVTWDSNQQTGFYGNAAFTHLFGLGFEQLLDNQDSSLIGRNWVPLALDACRSSPYDQIFFRHAGTACTCHGAGVEDLIEDASSALDNDILQALVNLANKGFAGGHVGAMNVSQAFEAYRKLVSDHLPVSVAIRY
jgi:hypothetical protein